MSVNCGLVANLTIAPGNSFATNSALSSSPAWYVITEGVMCFEDESIVGTWKPFVTNFVRTVPASPVLPDALMSLIVTSPGEGKD